MKSQSRIIPRILFGFCVLVLLGGLVYSVGRLTQGSIKDVVSLFNLRTVPQGQILPDPEAKNISDERKLKVARELADKVESNGHLPGRSLLADGRLGADSGMEELLQTLAVELQSSEVLGVIRTYQENLKIISRSTAEMAGTEAAVAAVAPGSHIDMQTEARDRAMEENTLLVGRLKEAFLSSGMNLTDEQITSLCAAPNADDIVGLAISFSAIATITRKIQQLVQEQPSAELARRYYGTYTVLLIALDKIQQNAVQKIRYRHLPRVADILREALATKEDAQRLIASPNATEASRQALERNIKRCDDTIFQARETEKALVEQATNLRIANEKLGYAIATASNTHRTLLLQTELAALIATCQAEVDALQALSLPPMLIVEVPSDNQSEERVY